VLKGSGDISKTGYPAYLSEKSIIDFATSTGCNIIIKNGYKGKWYVKYTKLSNERILERLDRNANNSRPGVYTLFISYMNIDEEMWDIRDDVPTGEQ